MAKSTSTNRTTKSINLPAVKPPPIKSGKTLPFNGNAVTEKSFAFSFACFDRCHKLFNLGDNTVEKVMSGMWFIELLDCLKSVCNQTITELRHSMHDFHPIDWTGTNAQCPNGSEQCEYWQFRINKSKGRVIGLLIDGVFYVVWLDPHHNLTNSAGYGRATKYSPALSLYEFQENKINELQAENYRLREELKTAEQLLNEV